MRKLIAIAAMAASLCMSTAEAASVAVGFSDLSIDSLSSVGPLTEGPFTYEAVSGPGWEIQSFFGNPPSALVTFFNSEGSASGDTVNFALTGGGTFSFDSVETSTFLQLNSDEVTITGYLGGVAVGSLLLNISTSSPNEIMTVASTFAGPIDLLQVVITRGTQEGTNNGRWLDNFTFSTSGPAVPEPSSLMLACLAGVCGLVTASRRRKACTAV